MSSLIYILLGFGLIVLLIMLYARSKGREAEAELTSEMLEVGKRVVEKQKEADRDADLVPVRTMRSRLRKRAGK